jgi:hypothetical protein
LDAFTGGNYSPGARTQFAKCGIFCNFPSPATPVFMRLGKLSFIRLQIFVATKRKAANLQTVAGNPAGGRWMENEAPTLSCRCPMIKQTAAGCNR